MEIEEINISRLEIKDQKCNTEEKSLALDIVSKNEELAILRRSGRKKIRPLEVETRRIMTRPRKLDLNQGSSKEIEAYYLSKKVKLSSPALETIFEEPKKDDIVFSTRKLRRTINFVDYVYEKPDKSKVKKRSMKAKKIIKGGFKKKIKKTDLDMLMKKLKELDSDNENN